MAFPLGWLNKQPISVDLSVVENTLQPLFQDTFNRADSSNVADSNWTPSDPSGFLSISNEKLNLLASSSTSIESAYDSTSKVLSGDFEVWFTSTIEADTTLPSTGQHICRLSVISTDGLFWYIDHRISADGVYQIYAGTNLGSTFSLQTGLQATETIKLSRSGTLISVSHQVNGFWEHLVDLTGEASTTDIVTQQIRWWCWNDNAVFHSTVTKYNIQTSQVPNLNEADFPFQITSLAVSADTFSGSNSDISDWRFTLDEVGSIELKFYIVSVNRTNHTVTAFVKVPLTSSTLSQLWLWYNNPSATSESNSVTVWKDPQAAIEMLTTEAPFLADTTETFADLTTNAWTVYSGTATLSDNAIDYTLVGDTLQLWASSASTAFKPGSAGEDFDVRQTYDLLEFASSTSTDYVEVRLGIVSLPSWTDYFQLYVRRAPDGSVTGLIVNNAQVMAGPITLPGTSGMVRFSRVNGVLKLYYWNSTNWEWNGSTEGFLLTSDNSAQYFMRLTITSSSSATSAHARIGNIYVSSYAPRSANWDALKTASLTYGSGLLLEENSQSAWRFTFPDTQVSPVPARQIINTLVGVVATVDSDTALGLPSQQNTSYSGSAFICAWADGNINICGTRVWLGSTDIGPFWSEKTNILSNGACSDFSTGFFAMHQNDGGIYQYGVSAAQSVYVVEYEATYGLTANTQLGLYTYPSDMVSVSAACDFGSSSNPAPVLSFISAAGDLCCASSANAPASYRAYDVSVVNVLKTGLPNAADSISQAVLFENTHYILWSEYADVNKYALKLLKHKEDVGLSSDFSGWGSLAHWNSEVVLLDGSSAYLSAVGDFRFIAATRGNAAALLWRTGTTLNYKIVNAAFGTMDSGVLTTELPGTSDGFTGGLLYIQNRRLEFHIYYLKDNGDSTYDLALTTIKLTNNFTGYEPNLGTWALVKSAETVSVPALSLRSFRLSCEVNNPQVLGIVYHNAANDICMLKETFWDFWAVDMHMGGSYMACVGAPTYYGMWAPMPMGPVEVLVAAQWRGSLYINIINSDTGALKWEYPQRLNNKISDNHQATYTYVDTKGYLWLVGRGRTGAPESAALLVYRSNKAINNPSFDTDVSKWINMLPNISAGRGYKTIESDQWGNIYIFWQFYGNMSVKIFSFVHQTWSIEFPLVVSAGDNWPDDFRWRSRKIVKDRNGHLHLFYGLRSKGAFPTVSASRGAFYMRIEPRDFSELSLAEFNTTSDYREFFTCFKADGSAIQMPHDTTDLLSNCDCILKSTSVNAHSSSLGDAMIVRSNSLTVALGQGIYDISNGHCYICVDFTTGYTELTSFNDTSDFTITGSGGITASNGTCDIDLTGFSGDASTFCTLTNQLSGNFDVRLDFTILSSGPADTTTDNVLSLHINPSGSQWTNYAGVRVGLSHETGSLIYAKASLAYISISTTATSGTLRLVRVGSTIKAYYLGQDMLWHIFPDAAVVSGQTIGTSDVDVGIFAQKGGSSAWHVQVTNFKNYATGGVTAATEPSDFSGQVNHNAHIVDGTVIWQEYSLFFDAFIRSYDWSGDILSPSKPAAGFNVDTSTREYVGEAPPLGSYSWTGFPWFVFEGAAWVAHHFTDTSFRPTRMGVTNNNIGDLYISTTKPVVNTKGYSILMPTALKTKDCETWEEVSFGLDADTMDSDIGSYYESPLGAPVGLNTTLAMATQNGRFTFFSTLQILQTAGVSTEFLGLFQGIFRGLF